MSLRDLAARLESSPGEELISYVSLGRIETGKQPYSQPILEAISMALNVPVSLLLEADPEKDGEIIHLINRLTPEKRRQAKAILEAFSKAS